MTDYSTDFDPGISAGNSADAGPYLSWHAAQSRDGLLSPGSWSLKDQNGRDVIDLAAGFVVDWPSSQTGWVFATGNSGSSPERRWNASRARFEPRPGDGWQRGFRISTVVLVNGQPMRALWMQHAIGAYLGFCELMKLVTQSDASKKLPQLPVIAFVGPKPVTFGGGPTLVPLFKLRDYKPRPSCLPLEQDEGWTDVAPSRTGGPSWGPSPQPSTGNRGLVPDDEIPF